MGRGIVKKNYNIYINSLKFNFYYAHWKETSDSVGIVGLQAELHDKFHVWAMIPFPVGPISPAASGQAPPGPVHPLPGSVYSRPRPARPCLAVAAAT